MTREHPNHDPVLCGGPPACGICNQDAASAAFRGDPPPPYVKVPCPTCGTVVPASQVAVRVTESAPTTTEAMIDGKRSANDVNELLRKALEDRAMKASGRAYCYVYVADFTDDQVVYTVNGFSDDGLNQCGYSIDAAGAVTLGPAAAVVRTYTPAPAAEPAIATESKAAAVAERIPGRVLEAKGTDANGGRIFRVRIIAVGDSLNGKRYTEAVLTEAAPLYEGAKAFDHHRTAEEMRSGTIAGLVGTLRNVAAVAGEGLDADLHLLPSATHAAEALDVAIAGQAEGLAPLVGISHDVLATFKATTEVVAGRQIQEATAIVQVNSADVVSHPAAGGKPVRVLAGGIDPSTTDPTGAVPTGESTRESDVTVNTADVLAALKTATPEQLAGVGLSRAGETTAPPTPPPAPVPTTESAPAAQPKDSFMGKLMVRQLVSDAGLPDSVVESVATGLPDRITEADVTGAISSLKAGLAIVERAGLGPSIASTQVTQESMEKKTAALDAFFAQQYSKGYRSFREAFIDITGKAPRAWGEDFNRTILRESFGHGFDSDARQAQESMTTASWDTILGDSITRRMVAMYAQPSLQAWRKVVSAIVPLNDFRTQRIERLGGYGTLPTVNQGAPYQPLTSPTDEEATYAQTKKGGTEDFTLEMIANDDVRAISRIPTLLGLAAVQTLFRFVMDTFPLNGATTYDSTALFHANHANTTAASPLSQTTLSAIRQKMRDQASYGDASNILSLVPRLLLVPNELEEIAVQLCTSAVAIPATPAGPSNTPNLHSGLDYEVVDYWTDPNDWFAIADPAKCPTFELGFYQGREEPEMFTQADESVGSVFNADKYTIKIRHIYGGAVLDHRGMQRAVG